MEASENNTIGLDPVDPMPWDKQQGIQCPKCEKIFSNAIGLRMHDIRKHQGRGWSTTRNFSKQKGKKGKPWTDEQRANFQKTIRRKLREKAKREQGIEKNRIQIVYPDPRDKISEAIKNTWPEQVEAATATLSMRFCPQCGEHLAKWRKE